MSSHDPLAVLEVAARNELESMLMEFDGKWEMESIGQFGERLLAHPDQKYRSLALAELVKIDLQRSWASGRGKLIEDYLRQFPSLGDRESVSADLIAAEYEARIGADSKLSLAGCESRFPRQFHEVKQLIRRLTDSSSQSSSPTNRATQAGQASIDTSRIDEINDTHDGKLRESIGDLPADFGRYQILKELGSGAMGKVFLAHDSQLDRHVALKTPSFSGSDNQDMVTRFYREARAAAKLQHRNICPIYDVGEIEGRHFISMAFVKGRCMSEFIKPDELPPQRTSAILVQRLAVALSEAHNHKIIHRDLKPANIMIDLKKEPIVMDFGLARQTDAESRVTRSGMAVGTPAYMSPEQVRGELGKVGAGADIYALGVILYELLTGRLPFRGTIAQVVYAIVNEAPAAPSSIRDGIDPELELICAKMMAKDQAERFQSMNDVACALKAYMKGENQTKELVSSPAKESVAPSAKSNTKSLTETQALNAFFAANSEATAGGTKIESALPLVRTVDSVPDKHSKRTRSSVDTNDNRRRRRGILIGAGFAGGFLALLGVVIYFNGGKIELDDDTDAVVEVTQGGNLLIRPSKPSSTEPEMNKPSGVSSQVGDSWQELIDPTLSQWVRYPSGLPVDGDWLVGGDSLRVAKASSSDIRTKAIYGDFELQFEWKLGKNGNSGVIYRVTPGSQVAWETGPEYQLLDEFNFKGSLKEEQRTGAIYGLFPPSSSTTNSVGEWNQSRIIAIGAHLEHWLNGTKVAEAEVASEDWESALRRNQRLDRLPAFAESDSGYIVLQSHRSEIAYRNIRVREIGSSRQSVSHKTERVKSVITQTKELPEDWQWSSPVFLGRFFQESQMLDVELGDAFTTWCAAASDGEVRHAGASGFGRLDLWSLSRRPTDSTWQNPVNMGNIVNSASNESWPALSRDGLKMLFGTDRTGAYDIWMTTRTSAKEDWRKPFSLGKWANSGRWDNQPSFAENDSAIYFASDRNVGHGGTDLYVTRLHEKRSGRWANAVNLGKQINTAADEMCPIVSDDGLTLFFSSKGRPGGKGGHDIRQSQRNSLNEPWSSSLPLGSPVNTDGNEYPRAISPDGRLLLFDRSPLDGQDLEGRGTWVVRRIPKLPGSK
ncbi:MAG: family 16 glycoside hydrolase [Planctomycetota bacterium]